ELSVAARSAAEEVPPVEDRGPEAEGDERAREAQELLLFFRPAPVDPGDLVVLAVGVVVASLRATGLVAAADHGHALRQEERREEVSHLTRAQGQDVPVLR